MDVWRCNLTGFRANIKKRTDEQALELVVKIANVPPYESGMGLGPADRLENRIAAEMPAA
jgi:hypothetical protein